jgi:predicted alpha/beta-hydrolase family hydrolase
MAPRHLQLDAHPEPLPAVFYAASSGSAQALLVLAHGAGAGQASPFMTSYAAALAARGLHVLTFDFPYMARGRKTPDRAPCTGSRR